MSAGVSGFRLSPLEYHLPGSDQSRSCQPLYPHVCHFDHGSLGSESQEGRLEQELDSTSLLYEQGKASISCCGKRDQLTRLPHRPYCSSSASSTKHSSSLSTSSHSLLHFSHPPSSLSTTTAGFSPPNRAHQPIPNRAPYSRTPGAQVLWRWPAPTKWTARFPGLSPVSAPP